MKRVIYLFFLFFLILSLSCKDDESIPKDSLKMEATIVWDGGPDSCNAFMLKKNNENGTFTYYKPDQLPKEFKEDNLPVIIYYYLTKDTYNCGFGGEVPIVIINQIKKK